MAVTRTAMRLIGLSGMALSCVLIFADPRGMTAYVIAYAVFAGLAVAGQGDGPQEASQLSPGSRNSAGQRLEADLEEDGLVIDESRWRNTGKWRRGDDIELVRWDPVIGAYFLNGNVWMDVGALAMHVIDLENRGYVPDSDAHTAAIREALAVDSWGEMFSDESAG